ncbi:MAG TPA: DUF1385 domain-containing protein [Clostridiales bacterium]|nr:DUF1385 domain-containing protein [Clostridia bacterium]MDD4679629.1 DUF1385 domain-containing protein [Clostridia bacterium]HCS75418.1 DUF1385 domain-containing protein [Clostridiales bacterium]
MKKTTIGGQAVMEGVMMKAPDTMAIAVRRFDGTIEVTKRALTSVKDRYPILKLPVLRGIITFGETMILGVKSLMTSAELFGEEDEEYKPSKIEEWLAKKLGKNVEDVIIYTAVILAVVFALGLFILLPAVLSSLIRPFIQNNVLVNLVEGFIRMVIFLIYLILVSKMKDIRRVFEYHGAEHKTIHCFEHDEELTVENARKYTTLHPRCGTAFLLIVMVISIVIFSFMGWQNIFIRILGRLLLLPFVAGLAYEITRIASRSDARIIRIIIYPGMMLQKLTTREPDDSQLEVAIRAFQEAAGDILVKEEGEESIESGTEAEGSVDSRAAVTEEPGSGISQA